MGFHRRVSESVGDPLSTYTARVTAIRAILGRHVPIEHLVQNNRVTNPIHPIDCLLASWGADATAVPAVTVSIQSVDDVETATDELTLCADPAEGSYLDARREPDELALVQTQLDSVWVLVGNCEVHLVHRDVAAPLLVDAAVEIARRVGRGPYTDDYRPPD